MPVAERTTQLQQKKQQQPNNNGENETKLDPSDPRVKKLVYNMYRDMLTCYTDDASAYIDQQDPASVTKDFGVLPIIETIL